MRPLNDEGTHILADAGNKAIPYPGVPISPVFYKTKEGTYRSEAF